MMRKALVKSRFRGEGILGKYLKENFYLGIFQLQQGVPQFVGLYGNPKIFRSISIAQLAMRMAYIQVLR